MMMPRFSDMWELRTVEDVCQIIMGQAPKGDSYNIRGDGTALIAGAADLGAVTPAPKKHTTTPTKVGKKGDIILCVRATIGDLNWADCEYCYGRGVAGLKAYDNVVPEFLWYWLSACKDHLFSLGRGATFKQISKQDVSSLPIPLPPLPEQRRIVARIKECMERVDEIERLRVGAVGDAYSLESAVFADFIESLDDGSIGETTLGDVVIDCKYGTSKKANNQEQGVPVLRMGNIQNGRLDLSDIKFVSLPAKERAKYLLEDGDILINRTNSLELVGKSAVFEKRPGDWVYASYLVRVRVDRKRALPEYVTAVINSRIGRDFVYQTARRAIGMVNINAKEMQRFPLPLPALQTQEQLVEQMQQVRPLAEEVNQVLGEDGYAHLREAILHKAFAGEL